MAGDICHIEIKVKDMDASRKFYEGLFGWMISGKNPDYLFFNPHVGVAGAFEKTDKDWLDGSVVFYVEVNDIPTILKTARNWAARLRRPRQK